MKKTPGVLIFIGLMLLMTQLRVYRRAVQEATSYAIMNNIDSSQIRTIYYIEFPETFDSLSITAFLGRTIGRYFFVIISILLIIIGFRIGSRNSWFGYKKLQGKTIKTLLKRRGKPNQQIQLQNDSVICIYEELDEDGSKVHKKMKLQELGPEDSKLPEEEFRIYNYYIFKTNNAGIIEKCRKFRFEGPFTDAAEVDDWDVFLNQ